MCVFFLGKAKSSIQIWNPVHRIWQTTSAHCYYVLQVFMKVFFECWMNVKFSKNLINTGNISFNWLDYDFLSTNCWIDCVNKNMAKDKDYNEYIKIQLRQLVHPARRRVSLSLCRLEHKKMKKPLLLSLFHISISDIKTKR